MARPPHVDAGDWAELQKALKQIGGDGGLTPQQLAAARPEDLGNAAGVEMAWAETAGKYADAHMGVLRVIKDKRKLRLTAMDDKIYEHFRAVFPDLKVAELSERDLSAPRIKAKFREFCLEYEKSAVKDFNFGTLLRLRASGDYEPENTVVVSRIQFLAIEIARNREGANDALAPQAAAAAAPAPAPAAP